MPQKLRPYPEYRDPVIPWVGEIPTHWKAKRLKRVVKNVADQTDARAADEIYIALENVESWTGKLLPASDGAEFEGLVKRFEPEDVLFGKLRPYLAKVTRPSHRGVCVGEFFVLRETGGAVAPEFLERLLRTAPFIHLVNSSTFGAKMPRADWNFVGNMEIACPPRQEQEHIVRFLKRVDELVDRLIDTKQRLIEVLTEQKQATMQRAVTRSLDPHAPTKATGIDWLPEVPEYWDIRKLKHVTKIGSGSTPSRSNETYWSGGTYPWLNSSFVNQSFVQEADQFVTDTALLECHLPIVAPGSVLVGITGQGRTRGKAAILGIEATINQHLAYLTPKPDCLLTGYLYLSLTGAYSELRSISDGSGSTKGALTCEDLKQFRIALPPIREQREIVTFTHRESSDIDGAIARARHEIDLICEYHTRLIFDVVTGKLDVRGDMKATKPKKANKHFHRAVLAAEIVDQYQGISKFGWIKLQKAVILAERHLQMDEIQSEPQRAAAGPFDNPMMRSIHKQLAAQKWFKPIKGWRGYTYVPMDKRGGHRRYFATYWGDKRDEFDRLLKLLRPMNTDQAEIVATLYMTWNDFLIRGEPVDDEKLVHEVLHHWDDSKRRFSKDRWRRAISWMRENALVPQGFGTVTVAA